MMVQTIRVALFSAALLSAATVRAAVSDADDLSTCRLPNGIAVLPVAGSAAASGGVLLKFSNNSMSVAPLSAEGAALSTDDTIAKIRQSKGADLEFLSDQGGSLLVFAGRVTELGEKYLAELAAKKLDEPGEIRKSSRNFAGQYRMLMEGSVYLVRTTDEKWAMLRILDKSDTSMTIQYIYQPDGTTTFDFPKNPPAHYQREQKSPREIAATRPAMAPEAHAMAATEPASAARSVAAAVVAPTAASSGEKSDAAVSMLHGRSTAKETAASLAIVGTRPALDLTVETFATQRSQLIQRRLDVVALPAIAPTDVDRKAQAIAELTLLHADEPAVADILVSEISFFNPRGAAKDFSPDTFHPAFVALKNLGKPATAAVLKGLRKLNLDDPGDKSTDSPVYKIRLLGLVVRAIEGDDVAEFIFKREANKETDPKRRAIFEFLESAK